MREDLSNNQNNDQQDAYNGECFENHYDSLLAEEKLGYTEGDTKTELLYGVENPYGESVYGEENNVTESLYGAENPYGESTYGDENSYENSVYGEESTEGDSGYQEENINQENSEEFDPICRKCGERYIDTSESKYSILCTKCREEQIHYPISKLFILAGLGLAILIAISFKQIPQMQKDYALYVESSVVKDADVTKSLEGLKQVVNNHDEFLDAKICMLDIAMQYGRYEEAGDIINRYLMGDKLDTEKYAFVFKYEEKLRDYERTYTKCEEIIAQCGMIESYDEAFAQVNIELQKLTENSLYSKSAVYYYMALFAGDINEQEMYMNESLKYDENYIDAQVYLANIKIYKNELNEGKEILEKILSRDNGVEAAYQSLAVINMLQGEMGKGLANAEKAYELNKEYLYSFNEVLMIALYQNNQNDRLETIKTETIAYEGDLPEDITLLLSGQTTLQEYFVGTKGGK